jgi:hypothetical protein
MEQSMIAITILIVDAYGVLRAALRAFLDEHMGLRVRVISEVAGAFNSLYDCSCQTASHCRARAKQWRWIS